MNPTVWEKRKQIKDRVYEIQVGTSSYFLKEKKTARHTDTKKHGHKPGLTSLEEYQTARSFNEQATIHKDDISLRWEKPIATVMFPDGFQFTVFEFEEGLRDADSARHVLEHEIERRREMYEVEFQLLQPMVEQMKDHPKVLSFESYSTES